MECLLLTLCPAVVDAACVLFRGPCVPEMPSWTGLLWILPALVPWGLLAWWVGWIAGRGRGGGGE